jgi:hypothetical protein
MITFLFILDALDGLIFEVMPIFIILAALAAIYKLHSYNGIVKNGKVLRQ